MYRFLALISLSAILLSCKAEQTPDDNIIYLKAFSDVYGVVRWFYPGDESQDVDWNKIALDGVRKIDKVKTHNDFTKVIQDIFAPVAYGVTFTKDSNYDTSIITPDDVTGMKEIAWQHYGADLGKWSNSYVSKRTYRTHESQGLNRLVYEANLSASNYIGDDLTLSVDIENLSPSSLGIYAKVSLDINDAETYINYCEFTPEYEVRDTYSKTVTIRKEDSNKIVRIGIYTKGIGKFRINGITLDDGAKQVNILDIAGDVNQQVYDYSDNRCEISTKDLLFDEHAHVGDVKSLEIVDGLYAHIPLALYGDDIHTYISSDYVCQQKHESVDSNLSDRHMMLADLIVTWNAIKYFHPYLSDSVKDWDKYLITAFGEVKEYDRYSLNPLRRMMANVNDAHFIANSPLELKSYGYLPVRVSREDDKIYVRRSSVATIMPGDEIVQIGDKKAIDHYSECENLVSGSPQYKTHIAEQIWLRQEEWQQKVTLLRDGERISLNVNRIERDEFINRLGVDNNVSSSRWIAPDTLYINTSLNTLAEIKDLLSSRDVSQTVLIDIRNGSSFMLMNILPYIAMPKDLMPFRKGSSIIPEIYMPESPVIKDTLTDIKVPNLKYNNVFLTGPMNYSHDEEVIDYALYCGIATTAGDPTAGCNGRINRMNLPSYGTVTFTGTKVFSHLGPQGYYYGKGIHPRTSYQVPYNFI